MEFSFLIKECLLSCFLLYTYNDESKKNVFDVLLQSYSYYTKCIYNYQKTINYNIKLTFLINK
nr:unnamed protein product [Callosobruchus analis]